MTTFEERAREEWGYAEAQVNMWDSDREEKVRDIYAHRIRALVLEELAEIGEATENYDCPIHGLQNGPDCARC